MLFTYHILLYNGPNLKMAGLEGWPFIGDSLYLIATLKTSWGEKKEITDGQTYKTDLYINSRKLKIEFLLQSSIHLYWKGEVKFTKNFLVLEQIW